MVPKPAPDDAGSEKQAKAIVAWWSLEGAMVLISSFFKGEGTGGC